MTKRSLAVACIIAATLSCSKKKGDADADTDPVEEEVIDVEEEADVEEEDAGPVTVDPIVPAAGTISGERLDCTDAYTLPAEFSNDEGLGHHGWTTSDLTFTLAWGVATLFDNEWISKNDASTPSMRSHPHLVPEAGYCYKSEVADALSGTSSSEPVLAPLVSNVSAFSHANTAYNTLVKDTYEDPSYDLTGDHALVAAIRGLYEATNAFSSAPTVDPWSDTLQESLLAATADYPAEMGSALARLVLSIGEAYALKQAALADADMSTVQRIHQIFLDDYYATMATATASPIGGTILTDLISQRTRLHLEQFNAAAMAVAGAADDLRLVLESVTPFDSPGIDVLTPHGRILVSTSSEDTTYEAARLADAALVVDLGGNDTYHGRYASTHRFWMSASVLVDASGDDLYTPETADIESSTTSRFDAFANDPGFTQGLGLVGVGVLIDGAGADRYTSTVYAQGCGIVGVGILHDLDGADDYRLGANGQGHGFLGIGLHVDATGDDRYGVYTVGQGAGKSYGHGALIDMDGTDTYICYYNDMDPYLPSPGYPNYFGLTSSWSYSDSEGNPHYMSVCQGVGWGYRHEWVTPSQVWRGGFGALVDFGTGNDTHYADCMAIGQGFVYGFGFLYDEGGDDTYRTFWWGPAASAHMGVSLFVEEDGNDDIHVCRLSGGYGYDCSVGWHIDNGGNDTFSGYFNYGKAYTYGLSFMINTGGDDVYNDGAILTDPPFGIVQKASPGANLIGMFMDLGGGTDTYNSAYAGVGNDAHWYSPPIGDDADPAFHKGVGIDK